MTRLDRRTPTLSTIAFLGAALLALLLAAGCEADEVATQIAAELTCEASCAAAETCGVPTCKSQCVSLASDTTLLAGCVACLNTAGSDCTWLQACVGLCDPGAIENPECAAFCADAVGVCPNIQNCIATCAALDTTKQATCFSCFQLNRSGCDVQTKCPECF